MKKNKNKTMLLWFYYMQQDWLTMDTEQIGVKQP